MLGLKIPRSFQSFPQIQCRKITANTPSNIKFCEYKMFSNSFDHITRASSLAQKKLFIQIVFPDPALNESTIDKKELLSTIRKLYSTASNQNSELEVNVIFDFSENIWDKRHVEGGIVEVILEDEDKEISIPKMEHKPFQTFERTLLGGTFDRLHAGHKLLLTAAVLSTKDDLLVGVVVPEMLKKKYLSELIEPLEKRKEKVEQFISLLKPTLPYHVFDLHDNFGPAVTLENLDALAVSTETGSPALDINKMREEKNWKPLHIIEVDLVDDKNEGAKFSSSFLRKRDSMKQTQKE